MIKLWIGSNYRIENVDDLTLTINSSRKNESFSINYNWEAGNLDESAPKKDKLLEKLLGGYKEFGNEFLRFIKYLGS